MRSTLYSLSLLIMLSSSSIITLEKAWGLGLLSALIVVFELSTFTAQITPVLRLGSVTLLNNVLVDMYFTSVPQVLLLS